MTHCVCRDGTGECHACKGTGRSGYFLIKPPTSAKACWRCKSSGCCSECGGIGKKEQRKRVFQPYIYVQHSLQVPTSIMAAAYTGGTWRFLPIPAAVLLRTQEAQQGWVSWRVRQHYPKNDGKCLLFGHIVAYRWCRSPESSVRLDVRGRSLEAFQNLFNPQSGSLSVGNKIVTVGRDGDVRIRSGERGRDDARPLPRGLFSS